MDAGNVVLIDVSPDFPRRFRVDPGTHLLIALSGVRRLPGDPLGVFFQNGAQSLGNIVDVRFGLLQLMGVQVHIFHGDGSGKHIHVPIKNISPPGADGGGAGLVSQGKPCVVVVIPDHQAVQPQPHRHKGRNSQHQRRQQHPPVLPGADAQAVIAFLPLPHGHPPLGDIANNGQQGESLAAHCSCYHIVWGRPAIMRTGRL